MNRSSQDTCDFEHLKWKTELFDGLTNFSDYFIEQRESTE